MAASRKEESQMTDTALIPIAALESQAMTWPQTAILTQVVDPESAAAVSSLLAGIKALRQEIAASTDPVIRAAHAAHKAAVKQKSDLEAPLIQAETILKTKVGAFAAEQQRKAREAAALAEAIAREAREKAEKEARELEVMGAPELADAVLIESAVTAAPPIAAPPIKIAGLSLGETWTFEITDLPALVAAVASGAAPLAFLHANEIVIGQMARAVKDTVRYPGIRIYSKPRVGTR